MKRKIKAISMLMAFVMLVVSCNFTMMFTSTAAATVSISTASDWASVVTAVTNNTEVTVNLNNDINFQGALLTSASNTACKVTFNGNNHIMSDFAVMGNGLFTSVADGSLFSNLGIYDAYVYDYPGTTADSGFGLLCGSMPSGKITNCFAAGDLVVLGTAAKNIGGLVGAFGGTMNDCFTMADIQTNGSYVGGLVGLYNGENKDAITYCYSTGTIKNTTPGTDYDGTPVYTYYGGLIGCSNVSCVANSYTSTFIRNAYADTVKAIGCIANLKDSVYFDETISLQRQEDLDKANDSDANNHRITPDQFSAKLNDNSKWVNEDGYYPMLKSMYSTSEKFKNISRVSAVQVNLARENGAILNKFNSTGREFTVLSSTAEYNYATLPTSDVTWRIDGVIDEYYFNPNDTASLPTSSGAMLNGTSGNVFDTNTGKYLFTTTGDVVFTAIAGPYQRDITVRVDLYANNPYIQGGTGTDSDPFMIDTAHELNMIRMYCANDYKGEYHYTINEAITAPSPWSPIVGFKGTLNGGSKAISGVSVTAGYKEGSGFIASISGPSKINDLSLTSAAIETAALADYVGFDKNEFQHIGVIGNIKADTTIKNLTLTTGVTVTPTTAADYVGVIANVEDEVDLTVNGIVLPATITVTSTADTKEASDKAVGFIGNVGGDLTLNNMSITAATTTTITASDDTDYVGFIGNVSGDLTSNSINLSNEANAITITASGKSKAVGYIANVGTNLTVSDDAGVQIYTAAAAPITITATGETENVGFIGSIGRNCNIPAFTLSCATNNAKIAISAGSTSTNTGFIANVGGDLTLKNFIRSGAKTATFNITATGAATGSVGFIANVGGSITSDSFDFSTVANAFNITASDTSNAVGFIANVGGSIISGEFDFSTVANAFNITATGASKAVGFIANVGTDLTVSDDAGIQIYTTVAAPITITATGATENVGFIGSIGGNCNIPAFTLKCDSKNATIAIKAGSTSTNTGFIANVGGDLTLKNFIRSGAKTATFNITATGAATDSVGFIGNVDGNLSIPAVTLSSTAANTVNITTTSTANAVGFVASVGKTGIIEKIERTGGEDFNVNISAGGATESVGFIGNIIGKSSFKNIDITKLAITSTGYAKHIGVFAKLDEETVINNIVIGTPTITTAGADYAGFIGYLDGDSNFETRSDIDSLHIANLVITANANIDRAGILGGYIKGAVIDSIFASGSIISTDNGKITHAGMLVAQADGSDGLGVTINNCATMGRCYSTDYGAGLVAITTNDVNITDCYSTAVVMDAQNCAGAVAHTTAGSAQVNSSVFTGMLSPAVGGARYGLACDGIAVNGSYFDKQSTAIFNQQNGKLTTELTSTDLVLNENWTKVQGKYPQLTVFSGSANSLIASLPVTYTYKYGGTSSSEGFSTASIPGSNFSGSADLSYAELDGTGKYTRSTNTWTCGTGGYRLYSAASSGVCSDIRYLLYNVNPASVYYKITIVDADGNILTTNDYSADMNGNVLANFITAGGSEYRTILDDAGIIDTVGENTVASYNGPLALSGTTSSLTVDLALPVKYSLYGVNAYTFADEVPTEIAVSNNTVDFYKQTQVYINIMITPEELPWGVYNIDCSQ